jgi:hypothetical protein
VLVVWIKSCKTLVLLWVLERRYSIICGYILVRVGCGGWLSSGVVDWPWRTRFRGLLRVLILFAFCKVGALPGGVALVWSAEVTVDF